MLKWLILLLCLAGTHAAAGAWPRQAGSGFASVATRLTFDSDTAPTSSYSSAYLEYGLDARRTLGIDAGRSGAGDIKAIAFIRLPLVAAETGHPVSAELGLGMIGAKPVLRPGISWGRGLAQGWLGADALAEIRQSGAATLKLDLTWGLKDRRGRMLILQVQSESTRGEELRATFAPSVVLPFGRNRHLELGGTAALTGGGGHGLKFGLWQEF